MKYIHLNVICFLAIFLLPSVCFAVQDTVGMEQNTSLISNVRDSLASLNAPLDSVSQKTKITKPLGPVYEFLSTRKFIWAGIIIILTYVGIGILIKLINLLAEKSTQYRITLKGMIPLIRILAWLFAITIIIVGIFAPNWTTIIAFSASIGVAVGFAAQDIIKNIFGGIMIIFDQPFKVGDKIEIGKYYGEVTEIGLRSTRMVTADDSLVSVPNLEVMNQSVSNSNSGETNCQVVAEFYLPLDVDTEKVRKIATEGAQVSRFVYLNKPIAVLFFQEIKEKRSYLKMRLKAYVLDIRYEFAFKSDMTELVLKALIKEGIISSEDYQ